MTQGEEWPVEFLFHPAEEETSEDTNMSNCLLCGFDHSSSECPNTVRVCKYCGGVGHPHEGIKHHRKVCCFYGINHSVVTECQIKWYEPFLDDFTISKENCNDLDEESLFPPGFNQIYEIGEPSNWPAPLDEVEDCSEVHYENFYWQSPSPADMMDIDDKESVGSCDGIIILDDEE